MSTYSLNFEDDGDTIRCDAKNDGFSILATIIASTRSLSSGYLRRNRNDKRRDFGG